MDVNEMNQQELREVPLSMWEWLLTIVVLAIPCVNIIMMFVWGFGSGNVSRRNFCRANLIMTAIGLVLVTVMYVTVGASIFALAAGM